jgi:hypothetical protein
VYFHGRLKENCLSSQAASEQLSESQAAIGMPEEASSRWLLTGFSQFVSDL